MVLEGRKIGSSVLTGPKTKNDCAGKDKQQFTRLDWCQVPSCNIEKHSHDSAGLGTNIHCAGKNQQQFTPPNWVVRQW
jgi:hypothetical protein